MKLFVPSTRNMILKTLCDLMKFNANWSFVYFTNAPQSPITFKCFDLDPTLYGNVTLSRNRALYSHFCWLCKAIGDLICWNSSLRLFFSFYVFYVIHRFDYRKIHICKMGNCVKARIRLEIVNENNNNKKKREQKKVSMNVWPPKFGWFWSICSVIESGSVHRQMIEIREPIKNEKNSIY